MKKLFFLFALFTSMASTSQSYQTKYIDEPVVTINCESQVAIADLSKIECRSSPFTFHIKSGNLFLSINGIIDKASPSQIIISLYAKESLNNEMIIIASGDSRPVQYKVEGAGSGSYGGNLNDNDDYIINTSFKITAPGNPAYLLVLPLNVHISRSGNNNFTRSFINGTACIYDVGKKKNKKDRKRTM